LRLQTNTPARQPDPADVDAGWVDQALHDAVLGCALFNLINRFVEGLGITADRCYFAAVAERLSEGGYAGLPKLFEP